MNFICNIFTTLLFHLTPLKLLFCFFPYLLPCPVCALYFFVCAFTPSFLHSPMSCTYPFLQSSVCVFAGSLDHQIPSLWVLLIHYSIHCSSINSAIVLLLSVPPSIYIPHNQCLIHPISTFLLPYVYSILPAIFPFLYPDNTYSICCELVPLNRISFSLSL